MLAFYPCKNGGHGAQPCINSHAMFCSVKTRVSSRALCCQHSLEALQFQHIRNYDPAIYIHLSEHKRKLLLLRYCFCRCVQQLGSVTSSMHPSCQRQPESCWRRPWRGPSSSSPLHPSPSCSQLGTPATPSRSPLSARSARVQPTMPGCVQGTHVLLPMLSWWRSHTEPNPGSTQDIASRM